MNKEQGTIERIIFCLSKQKRLTKEIIADVKRKISGEECLPPPSTADLLSAYRQLLASGQIKLNRKLESILVKRAVRTLSGVAVVTVLTKPWPCPGRCIYCPKQTGMPKSYLKNEPAAQRAYLTKFDPYRQVVTRLQMLYNNGHPTDKIELIVKGGSWQAYPWKYQVWFIEECFRAANDVRRLKDYKIIRLTNKNNLSIFQSFNLSDLHKLANEQKKNETSHHRIIGLTLETRPDLITPESIKQMRFLGCTRVELGVQHTDDRILKLVRRGHNLQQTKSAVKLLKDAGFKVDYHLMPQLPGSTPKKDYEMFKKIFADLDLRPDMIKIYPCSVVKGSELYNQHKRGKFWPYSNKKLVELLIKVKSKLIPRYCRISRLIRDIPATDIVAGNCVTNLREVIKAEMKKRGLGCSCLRCREVGHAENIKYLILNIKLFIDKYIASGGIEYFLSFEDSQRRIVYAFCRLRINHLAIKPFNNFRPKADPPTAEIIYPAFIRELHTYGQAVPLKGLKVNGLKGCRIQHLGLGRQLIIKAEEIVRQAGIEKIAVIAGVGVREYYRRLGYQLKNTYLVKNLQIKTNKKKTALSRQPSLIIFCVSLFTRALW